MFQLLLYLLPEEMKLPCLKLRDQNYKCMFEGKSHDKEGHSCKSHPFEVWIPYLF